MDEAKGTLIGCHGYCTQEMVNLLLTGRAVSNVFDGDVELDSGGENKVPDFKNLFNYSSGHIMAKR